MDGMTAKQKLGQPQKRKNRGSGTITHVSRHRRLQLGLPGLCQADPRTRNFGCARACQRQEARRPLLSISCLIVITGFEPAPAAHRATKHRTAAQQGCRPSQSYLSLHSVLRERGSQPHQRGPKIQTPLGRVEDLAATVHGRRLDSLSRKDAVAFSRMASMPRLAPTRQAPSFTVVGV